MKKFYIIMPIVTALCATHTPKKMAEPLGAEQLIEHIHQLKKTPGYHLLHPIKQKATAHTHEKLTKVPSNPSNRKLSAPHKKIAHHKKAIKELKKSYRNTTVSKFLKQLESLEKGAKIHKVTPILKKDLADMRANLEKHLRDDALPADFVTETQRKLKVLTKRVYASFTRKTAEHTPHPVHMSTKGRQLMAM